MYSQQVNELWAGSTTDSIAWPSYTHTQETTLLHSRPSSRDYSCVNQPQLHSTGGGFCKTPAAETRKQTARPIHKVQQEPPTLPQPKTNPISPAIHNIHQLLSVRRRTTAQMQIGDKAFGRCCPFRTKEEKKTTKVNASNAQQQQGPPLPPSTCHYKHCSFQHSST